MSAQGYANQTFVDQAHDDFRAEQRQQREDAEAAAKTRQQLEAPAEPVPDDDAPATVDETETDGGGMRGFIMTQDRRVGSMAVPVDGHGNIRFGKPSGRASMKMLEPIDEMEEDEGEITDLGSYIWPTLGQWAVDGEYDEDFFADEMGLLDAITTLRSVALGGNPSALS